MGITRNQHVLSASLQRPWANTTGKVFDYKFGQYPSTRTVKPERTGFVRDFLPQSIANEAEAVWQQVEELLPKALDDCASKNPSEDSLQVVSDLAALHLARSHRSKEDWDGAVEVGFDDSGIKALLAEPEAGPAFFRERTGLIAAGPEAAALGVDFGRERVKSKQDRVQLGEFKRRFDETRLWLRSAPCVVRCTDAPLFIGDDPVLLFSEAGIVRAPGQAEWLMMPIGPFLLLEWPDPGHGRSVDAGLVGLLNTLQVKNAWERVIARPQDKDDLLQLVAEHRVTASTIDAE